MIEPDIIRCGMKLFNKTTNIAQTRNGLMKVIKQYLLIRRNRRNKMQISIDETDRIVD